VRLSQLLRDFVPWPAVPDAKKAARYPSAETIDERASHAHSSSAFDAFEIASTEDQLQ
jgi:hypothetical protein